MGATLRSLGDAITKITGLDTRLTKAESDLKATKAAHLRALQRISELESEGVVANINFQQSGSTVVRTLEDKVREGFSITDFLPLSPADDWRTALDTAIAFLGTLPKAAGRIKFPYRSTSYTFATTSAAGPVLIPYDGLEFIGDSGYGTEIENNSTDGTPFFRFSGSGGRDFIAFKSMKITSGASAGEIWDFANDTGLGKCSLFQNLYVQQKNLSKAGMKRYDDVVGAYEATFDNCYFDHGTSLSYPGTVPFFDLGGTIQSVQNIEWRNCRINCRYRTVPFFHIKGDAASVYQTGLKWSVINVENARGPVWKLDGCMGALLDTIVFYDSGTTSSDTSVDGHFIETGAGANGRESSSCVFRNITIKSGTPKGVLGTTRAATPFTSSGSTVTFTYNSHGYVVGQRLYVTGGGLTAGRYTVVAKTTNTFDITHSSPPASGNADVAEAACAIKLGSTATKMVFENINGPSGAFPEVDLNQRSADVRGGNNDVLFSRVLETSTTLTYSGSGGVARIETAKVMTDSITERTVGGGVGFLVKILVDTIAEKTAAAGVTIANVLKATGGIRIGSSGPLRSAELLFTGQAVNPGAISANSTKDVDLTLTGVGANDFVKAEPQGSVYDNGLTWCVFCKAADTVTVRFANSTTGSITPSSRNWNFLVTVASA